MLRAVCQNARLRDPGDVIITHFMSSGADVCWQGFAPPLLAGFCTPPPYGDLPRRYTKGRLRAHKVIRVFSGFPYLTFTTTSRAGFVEVILSVFK